MTIKNSKPARFYVLGNLTFPATDDKISKAFKKMPTVRVAGQALDVERQKRECKYFEILFSDKVENEKIKDALLLYEKKGKVEVKNER